MRRYGTRFKTVFDRALATALLILLPLAGPWRAARSDPPPPRFVPVSRNIAVAAAWEGGTLLTPGPSRPAAPAADTDLLAKTAAPNVRPDGILHYGVSATNATTATQTFRLTDTLTSAVSYVPASATGGFVYDPASTSLTATLSLLPFHGDVITTTGAPPYIEISNTAVNICQTHFLECDDSALLVVNVPFRYLGVDYNSITLDSNGFVVPGAANTNHDNANQHLPDPAAPNDVIAPFWTDLDLNGARPGNPGGGDWYYGLEHDNGANADYFVVEWYRAQKKGDSNTAYTFQIWIQLNAEHITFVYNALIGDTLSDTIGFENGDGTLGHSYLYNGTGTVPASGDQLQLVAVFDTALLGYDVHVQPDLPNNTLITNTVQLSNGPGTLTATAAAVTTVKWPTLFLPLIAR